MITPLERFIESDILGVCEGLAQQSSTLSNKAAFVSLTWIF
jgi:hypothetical protein